MQEEILSLFFKHWKTEAERLFFSMLSCSSVSVS